MTAAYCGQIGGQSWDPEEKNAWVPPIPAVEVKAWDDAMTNTMAYYRAILKEWNTVPGKKPVRLVPGGPALVRLEKEIADNKVPGVTDFASFTFSDAIHLSAAGRYLVSLVHYACIYGESPEGKVTWANSGLNKEQAIVLRHRLGNRCRRTKYLSGWVGHDRGRRHIVSDRLASSRLGPVQGRRVLDPVCGVIYRCGNVVTNGMALGGIDTGCVDLETSGLLGYATIFNSHAPRRGPINLPVLGMSVGGKTWVYCDPTQTKQGWGGFQGGSDGPPIPAVWTDLNLDGVQVPKQIHYWGHYPVVDLEFDTDAPVSVGMRAWSPFFPGHTKDSAIPGIVFEVHLRNTSTTSQHGTVAFFFPGPNAEEAGTTTFTRANVQGGFNGVVVGAKLASYALGVIGPEDLRMGGELGAESFHMGRYRQDDSPGRRKPARKFRGRQLLAFLNGGGWGTVRP